MIAELTFEQLATILFGIFVIFVFISGFKMPASFRESIDIRNKMRADRICNDVIKMYETINIVEILEEDE